MGQEGKTTNFSDKLKNLIRALRLPFSTASILPFIFGSLLVRNQFKFLHFILGFFAVLCTHLSANLINDYADSKSGADWLDKKFYGFFGGSKLIQEKVFSEKFYLVASVVCFSLAFTCIVTLAAILKSMSIIVIYLAIVLLAVSYSKKPLQFSYRRTGEFIIFFLFGPVLVMGGYFIQTGIFPTVESFILSLPFGFLTTAILFANEIPDFPEDKKAGKFTWVSIMGPERAYLLYYTLVFCAFLCIILSVVLGFLKPIALLSLIFILPALKAAGILKKFFADKKRLIESSKLTIAVQAVVSIILILGAVL